MNRETAETFWAGCLAIIVVIGLSAIGAFTGCDTIKDRLGDTTLDELTDWGNAAQDNMEPPPVVEPKPEPENPTEEPTQDAPDSAGVPIRYENGYIVALKSDWQSTPKWAQVMRPHDSWMQHNFPYAGLTADGYPFYGPYPGSWDMPRSTVTIHWLLDETGYIVGKTEIVK